METEIGISIRDNMINVKKEFKMQKRNKYR